MASLVKSVDTRTIPVLGNCHTWTQACLLEVLAETVGERTLGIGGSQLRHTFENRDETGVRSPRIR
jgi:hypothetical protein